MHNKTIIALALAMTACGSHGSSSSSDAAPTTSAAAPAPTPNASKARVLALASDVPTCDSTSDQDLVFVQATASYEQCINGSWQTVSEQIASTPAPIPATHQSPISEAQMQTISDGGLPSPAEAPAPAAQTAAADPAPAASPAPQLPGPMDASQTPFTFCFTSLNDYFIASSSVTVSYYPDDWQRTSVMVDFNGPNAGRYGYTVAAAPNEWDANAAKTVIIHDFLMTEVVCPAN